MGFRFRKSIKAGPVRFNLSNSGVGYSIGAGGFRYTSSPKKKKKGQNTIWVMLIKWMLYLLGASVVLALLVNYWYIWLILVVLAGSVWGLIKLHNHVAARPDALPEATVEEPSPVDETPASEALPEPEPQKSTWQIMQEEEEARKKAIEAEKEIKKAEFSAALANIPLADIALSEPVQRHKLKDLPEYTFSNITRKTRLDSIFPLVVLDVETTGFAPSKCEILEVAAIKFDKGMEPIAAFTTLCKPQKPIPEEASEVNNITDDMVANAPEFSRIAPALTEFLKGCHIAGHNLDFDLRFIFAHGAELPPGVRFYDTLDLAHLTIPESHIGNYKLKTVCSYYGIVPNDSHRSLSDAYATSKVFLHLVLDKTGRQLDDNEEILTEKDAE